MGKVLWNSSMKSGDLLALSVPDLSGCTKTDEWIPAIHNNILLQGSLAWVDFISPQWAV